MITHYKHLYISIKKFLFIFFIGLSTYKNEYGSFVAFLNFWGSTPSSDDIIFLSLEDGNSNTQYTVMRTIQSYVSWCFIKTLT